MITKHRDLLDGIMYDSKKSIERVWIGQLIVKL